MRIKVLNKKGIPIFRVISKKNLKNYEVIKKIGRNKIFQKKQYAEVIKNKRFLKTSYKILKGRTKTFNKKSLRIIYKVSMNINQINIYNSYIKNLIKITFDSKYRYYKTMRIGVKTKNNNYVSSRTFEKDKGLINYMVDELITDINSLSVKESYDLKISDVVIELYIFLIK